MIMCQGFQDKLENESLHSVAVQNAEGDSQGVECSTFDNPQVRANHLVLERSSRHNVDRWESDMSSPFSSLPFWCLMRWNENDGGQRRVEVCMSEVACEDVANAAIKAMMICVVKIQNLQSCTVLCTRNCVKHWQK
jgi:hypothetical protein